MICSAVVGPCKGILDSNPYNPSFSPPWGPLASDRHTGVVSPESGMIQAPLVWAQPKAGPGLKFGLGQVAMPELFASL